MSIAKLKAAAFRLGRGGLPEALRQFASETATSLQVLRAAILELDGRTNDLENAPSGGTSTPDLYIPFAFDTSNNLVYLPINQVVPTSTITEAWVQWTAPRDLQLVSVNLQVVSGSDYGNTTVGCHIDGNTTAEESSAQSLDAADGLVSWPFSTDVDAGERLSISFNGQFNGGEVSGYARLVAQ